MLAEVATLVRDLRDRHAEAVRQLDVGPVRVLPEAVAVTQEGAGKVVGASVVVRRRQPTTSDLDRIEAHREEEALEPASPQRLKLGATLQRVRVVNTRRRDEGQNLAVI